MDSWETEVMFCEVISNSYFTCVASKYDAILDAIYRKMKKSSSGGKANRRLQ